MSEEKLDDGWEALAKIQVIEREGRTEVLVKGQSYMDWALGDEASRRMAVVQLYRLGTMRFS